jgi:hypothetical protein
MSTRATATTRSRRRYASTKPTSSAIYAKETIIDNEADPSGPLELRDILVIETNDGQSLEFEVVGLVEDDENNAYAVCYSEKADEFVVTDATGNLLSNDELAQEILDDFFVLAEESGEGTPEG